MATGYISGRQLVEDDITHGEITTLPFGNGVPFAIMIVDKVPSSQQPNGAAIIDCKLLADAVVSPYPIEDIRNSGEHTGKVWTERNIILIPDTETNQNLLEIFKIYWVAGEYSPTQTFS